MFILGHMGIGVRLASPWANGLPRMWLLAGTLFPDVLDKALYYGASWATGLKGAELGLISSTRTVGHTALFLILLASVAALRRSRRMAALSFGIATHLLLDNLGDRLQGFPESSAFQALVFPFFSDHFAAQPFGDAQEHLSALVSPFTVGAEILGGSLLAWEAWKIRNRSEIYKRFRSSRIGRLKDALKLRRRNR